MQPQKLAPDGGQRDRPKNNARPPSNQSLNQILAGEDVLEEARSISQRIWKRVWQLIRLDPSRASGSVDGDSRATGPSH